MAMTRKVATVFGGSGFIGRHVVKRLAAQGYIVRVAVRDTQAASFLKPMGGVGQIIAFHAPLDRPELVAAAVDSADIAVNLAGILSERRRGDFDRVHAQGAAHIAGAAAKAGVRRLVHLSAIGADAASPSRYARSKAAGEAALRAGMPGAVILRPSVLFGPEDRFFNRFAEMALLSPVIPIVGGATRFQPVYVADVADAVLAALTQEDAAGQVYELGGPDVRTFKELIEYMLKTIERHRRILDLPVALARLNAVFLERLPGQLLTGDQIKLLRRDNMVAPGARDLASLGVAATPLDLVVPGYLARFCASGRRALTYRI